jgi:glycerol-3-phosphate dehydrogenase (NAD(P)+)
MTKTIGIIGAGAWGTALAQVYAAAGNNVTLWAREPEVVAAVNAQHENTVFLSGVKLHTNIRAVADMTEGAKADVILLVTPAQHVRSTIRTLRGDLGNKPVVICAKGLETATGKMLSDVAAEEASGLPVAVLTGPTFAGEIARGLPSAVTVAAAGIGTAEFIRDALASKTLRPYVSTDLTGVQIGGAVKNVIAIASGIVAGKGLGDSARAALITRGLAEITRLAVALGAQPATLAGLAGMGDLVLTCTGSLSRNRGLGIALAKGEALEQVEGETRMIAEGARTVRSALALASRHGVSLPICEEVAAVLFQGKPPAAALQALLGRAPTREDG